MISMKVENDDVWDRVKSGEIKGFSIEGSFADKLELKKHEDLINQIIKVLENGG
jgi:phage head maturation protease